RGRRALRRVDGGDAWLQRLLINACYQEARRRRSRPVELRVIPSHHAAPTDSAQELADRDELERGFRRLPVEQRTVLVLHHYLGLSLQEVADAVRAPLGTVKSRLHYATRSMRAALEADARTSDGDSRGRTA